MKVHANTNPAALIGLYQQFALAGIAAGNSAPKSDADARRMVENTMDYADEVEQRIKNSTTVEAFTAALRGMLATGTRSGQLVTGHVAIEWSENLVQTDIDCFDGNGTTEIIAEFVQPINFDACKSRLMRAADDVLGVTLISSDDFAYCDYDPIGEHASVITFTVPTVFGSKSLTEVVK